MRHYETEIKLEVRNSDGLERRLAQLGLRRVEPRHFETNVLFDYADRRLRHARCLLRLRFVDSRGIMTFKGPPVRARGYKIRREIETTVSDCIGATEIFRSLGLQPMFRYEKYRTVYASRRKASTAGSAELAYDETPIGNYFELEGPRSWIDRMARRLGYARRDYIASSYGALYYEKCLEAGKRPENMVFKNKLGSAQR